MLWFVATPLKRKNDAKINKNKISQVGTAIDACSSSNTEASLKAAIAQGVTNKALADQVPAC